MLVVGGGGGGVKLNESSESRELICWSATQVKGSGGVERIILGGQRRIPKGNFVFDMNLCKRVYRDCDLGLKFSPETRVSKARSLAHGPVGARAAG